MNAVYRPGSGIGPALNRRWARFAARAPMEIALDQAIVTFTFDDFPKSAVTEGAKRLDRRGWKGTFYASAGFAGGMTHHGRMFDPADLHALHAQGHEIGCHTYGHIDPSQARLGEVLADVERNSRALALMGHDEEMESFAFPYGEATPAAKRALAEHFVTLRGVHADINRGQADRNLLKSVPIDGGENGVARAVEAASSAADHPGWLIYYTHDIQAEPTQWGCTPDQFERVCAAVEDSGARVLSMAAARREIETLA